uniref:Uncharacterized protein n=1 Tax=Anguilla anguilla TaxID=7936 RepID=A0A0E9RI88_ANGAN
MSYKKPISLESVTTCTRVQLNTDRNREVSVIKETFQRVIVLAITDVGRKHCVPA